MSFQDVFAQRNNKPRPVTIAGYPCLVRRPAIRAWLSLGLIPQSLAEAARKYAPALASLKEQDAESALADLNEKEVNAIGQKWQELIITLCVTGDDGTQFSFGREDGKVDVLDLDNASQFIEEAITAVMSGPIPTAEGELSADALNTFPGNGNGKAQPAGARVYGPDLLDAPVRAHRPARSRRGA